MIRRKERTRMVVVRHYILNASAALILLAYACNTESYGLTSGGSLVHAGVAPDPSVIVLVASALVSTALCKRVTRRMAMGF
jgi:hypothetical protein